MAEFVHILPKYGLKQPSIFLECNQSQNNQLQQFPPFVHSLALTAQLSIQITTQTLHFHAFSVI